MVSSTGLPLLLLLLALVPPGGSFLHSPGRIHRRVPGTGGGPARRAARLWSTATTDDALAQALEQGQVDRDARQAIDVLRRDSAAHQVNVTDAQCWMLLDLVPFLFSRELEDATAAGMDDSLGMAGSWSAIDMATAKVQANVASLYRMLMSREMLRGFGSVEIADVPCKQRTIQADDLEGLIGMNQSALTPGGQGQLWAAAGLAFCLTEFAVAQAAGLDPVNTVFPATIGFFLLDRLVFQGALFETAYRTVAPQYREKVIRHEAAHFLVAYLLGCPVESCIISAFDAMSESRFDGQAGTIFFDPEFGDQMASGNVPRSSIDRFTVIVMAGIAAEARKYGKAEGGLSDESTIISLLLSTNPPWNLDRIQQQARWGVVQASLLLEEHEAAYEALVEKLMNDEFELGACVAAIEGSLPSRDQLPGIQRRTQRFGMAEAEDSKNEAAHTETPALAAEAGTTVGPNAGPAGASEASEEQPGIYVTRPGKGSVFIELPPPDAEVEPWTFPDDQRIPVLEEKLGEVEQKLAQFRDENPSV